MDWKVFLMTLICCLKNVYAIDCASEDAPRTREFPSLVAFQGNKLSFKYKSDTYLGSSVNFSFGSVDRLPKNTFISYTSKYITAIDLSNKSIKNIDDGAFNSLTCLCDLDLSKNLISSLDGDLFRNLTNLRTLNISENYLTNVSSNVFFNLTKLKELNISYNNILEISESAFDSNPSTLEILDISHNAIKHLQYFLFSNLIYLRELYLDHNSIAIVNTSVFSSNKRLEKLDLSGNELVLLSIFKDSFNPRRMQLLNLSNNCLMDLNISSIVNQFSNTKVVIDINDNQFYCSEWEQYVKKFTSNNVTITPGRNFTAKIHIDGMVCDNLNFTYHGHGEEMTALHRSIDESGKHFQHLNDTDGFILQDLNDHSKIPLIHSKTTDNNLTFEYVCIALGIIGLAFCTFLALDYFKRVGYRRRLASRARAILLNNGSSNSHYVQLDI